MVVDYLVDTRGSGGPGEKGGDGPGRPDSTAGDYLVQARTASLHLLEQ
jgi:hypothetical protein